ncbi:MAG: hypothetical protein ACR2HY_09230 [Acidimicrobiales bacterium]
MEDDDLTNLLHQAGDAPNATPDSFREVMTRYQRGRTRALAIALAAVALIGPVAGVVVGRATAHNGVQVATGGPPATSSPVGAVETRPAVGGAGSSALAGPAPPKRLFVRTTADGVAVRAYLADFRAPVLGKMQCANDKGTIPCPPPPPADCFPASQLQIGLSDEGAVDPGYVPVMKADEAGALAVLRTSFFGLQEGTPAAWVAVHTGPGVARVRVRFSDGAVDEMAPGGGYAALAHRMVAPPTPTKVAGSPEDANAFLRATMPQGTAEALDASGAVVATADLGSSSVSSPNTPHCIAAPAGPAQPLLPPPATVVAPAAPTSTRPR